MTDNNLDALFDQGIICRNDSGFGIFIVLYQQFYGASVNAAVSIGLFHCQQGALADIFPGSATMAAQIQRQPYANGLRCRPGQ